MPLWLTLLNIVEAFSLPLLASLTLGVSKLTVGATAQAARRWFVGVLVAVTLITCRTVVTCDPTWLMHTVAVSMLFVGALAIPDRESFSDHRLVSRKAF